MTGRMQSPDQMPVAGADGVRLVLQRYPAPERTRLILSHGNGFAIDGYRRFWSLLAGEFELVLFDLRNHGRSGATPVEAHTIANMAADHALVAGACRDAFGPRLTVGVFHSVSAIAATLAGAAGSVWDRVVLVDPPLVSLDRAHDLAGSADHRLAVYARGRPERFDTLDALAGSFIAGAGRNWVEGAARDMAEAITRQAPGGSYELVCPGEYEARIYEQNSQTDSYGALGAMRTPVAILGADPLAPRALHPALVSRTAARDLALPYEFVPRASHMLQLEKPEETAAALRTLLARLGAG